MQVFHSVSVENEGAMCKNSIQIWGMNRRWRENEKRKSVTVTEFTPIS